jgi:outer membrane protein OmpA-like peptidoglycan-associated protein
MIRKRRNIHSLLAFLGTVGVLLGSALVGGAARAGEPELITGPPLPAAELADMLYPVKTRGIVMDEPKATPFAFLIQFEFDSAEVKPESRPYLDEVGKMMGMNRLAGKRIAIVGHADASGPEAYNQQLSEQRAQAVVQYLARFHGVELERLVGGGRGEQDPIDPANPYDAKNRRVQFHPAD